MARRKRRPKYCLHKGSGQAVVRINGQDKYLGVYDSPESLAEYDRLIAKWEAEETEPPTEPPPVIVPASVPLRSVTVAVICDAYITALEKLYDRPTANSDSMFRAKAAVGHLLAFAAFDPANKFGPIRLDEFRDYLLKQRKGEDKEKGVEGVPLSRGYINDLVDEVVRIFRHGVSRELLHPDVPAALETLKPLRAGLCEAREPDEVDAVDDTVVVRPFRSYRQWSRYGPDLTPAWVSAW